MVIIMIDIELSINTPNKLEMILGVFRCSSNPTWPRPPVNCHHVMDQSCVAEAFPAPQLIVYVPLMYAAVGQEMPPNSRKLAHYRGQLPGRLGLLGSEEHLKAPNLIPTMLRLGSNTAYTSTCCAGNPYI